MLRNFAYKVIKCILKVNLNYSNCINIFTFIETYSILNIQLSKKDSIKRVLNLPERTHTFYIKRIGNKYLKALEKSQHILAGERN